MQSNNTTGPANISRRSFLRGSAATMMVPLVGGGLGALLSACSDGQAQPAANGTEGEAANGSDTLSGRYMTALGFSLSFIETVIAKEQGFFDEQGLFLEILGGQGTATALQSVLGGTTQLSRANAINGIIAIANEQAPIINIGTVRQRGQFELVSLPDSPINSPDDLSEGLTIGIVSAAGATENLLDLILSNQGIDLGSIQRPVTGVGPAGYELARDGSVDAWISVNTDRQTLEDDGNDLVSFNIYDHVDLPSDTYCCALELVENDDDRPARFLAGVLQAMDWATDESNWEQAVEHLRVYNNEIDTEAALVEFPLMVEDWNANGEDGRLALVEQKWSGGQEALTSVGLVNETVELDKLIYPDYLEQARERI
ncbi:ABC transporter substrate-binding protein [Egicoccus sp. AB-alg2]|uniref:ABC transporter substrate-binding protein n=1 Tax=Egicoccus sp. AB-alg2 TaxID=3242693 RepID=UPI00359EEE0B